MVRDGQQVTVRALTRMPGVADGQVRHLPWDPRLVALVDAGRYELLDVDTPNAGPDRKRNEPCDEAGDPTSDERPEDGPARSGHAAAEVEPAARVRPRTGRSR